MESDTDSDYSDEASMDDRPGLFLCRRLCEGLERPLSKALEDLEAT